MSINAFKDSVTVLNATNLNSLISQQDFKMLYEGSVIDSKTGAGTTANDVFTNNYAVRITTTGVTSISRIELEIDQDGAGADLTVEIRGTDFATNGTNEGTLLKTVIVPKEFLPTSAGTLFSVPINLTGLSAGANYWCIIKKAGDSTNHFHVIGEASADGSHPCYYRAGDSGAWSANNALHFVMYSGDTGEVVHCIYGTNGVTTIKYSGETISKIYRYLPPSDGSAGGIREVMTYTWNGEYLVSGAVS